MNEHTEMREIQNDDGPNDGATLIWRNVNVFVKDKKQRGKDGLKQIISNSTGSIEPGRLMAVMGARYVSFVRKFAVFRKKLNCVLCIQFSWQWNFSGAGKSTLMSALAYRNMSEGFLILNASKFRK